MGRKPKHNKETKLLAVHQYQQGLKSIIELSNELLAGESTIRNWIKSYEILGEQAFDYTNRNKSYSAEFKLQVINSYLNGEGSYSELSKKYKIANDPIIQAPLGGLFKSSALIDGIVYCFVENASYNILCFDDGTGELLARVSLDEDFDTAKALSIWIESLVS